MKYSTDRILTTHAGALPQPPDLKEMHSAQAAGKPVQRDAFEKRVRDAVSEAVRNRSPVASTLSTTAKWANRTSRATPASA